MARLIFKTIRKFVSHPGEAWLLCRMAWWVMVLSVTARCYSLPRALQIVDRKHSHKKVQTARQIISASCAFLWRTPLLRHGNPKELSAGVTSQNDLARAIDLLLSADVFVFKPVCWKRAAVLHRYLSINGIPTRIIFGVRNETDDKLSGHAWLEANGLPILERTPPEYIVTYSFPV